MATLMAPLHEEHQALLPHITELRATADAVGVTTVDNLRWQVEAAVRFLVDHLIPHATAEDEVLYPAVGRVLGAPEATATMQRDHVEVHSLTHQLIALHDRQAALEEVPDDLARDLRRVLYGLYALVTVHFAKEEEVYLPLLEERLTAEEADDLLRRLAAAGGGHDH